MTTNFSPHQSLFFTAGRYVAAGKSAGRQAMPSASLASSATTPMRANRILLLSVNDRADTPRGLAGVILRIAWHSGVSLP